MFEINRIQAVTLREDGVRAEKLERKFPEGKIQLKTIPKDIKNFFDSVPLGFQLEAYVKKASKDEVVLKLIFRGKELEVAVKNLLGIKFKPGQKVVLTLLERNPYVLKIQSTFSESYKIFSHIRRFLKISTPKTVFKSFSVSSPLMEIKNSGIFYENRIVNALLGKEKIENLKKDLKYQLLSLIEKFGFDKPRYQLLVKPTGFSKTYFANFPFFKINLDRFLRAYGAFYRLSPKAIENLLYFIEISRIKVEKKFLTFKRKGNKIRRESLDKPIFFSTPKNTVYENLKNTVSVNQLKETVEFLQFLQSWIVNQGYDKAIIPFIRQGKKFFMGIYGSGNRKNISLLWEKGLVKLSYDVNNPFEGKLLFVLKDENLVNPFKEDIENLKKDLERSHFRVKDLKFAVASNVEELFILDMANKEYSNFVKLYL